MTLDTQDNFTRARQTRIYLRPEANPYAHEDQLGQTVAIVAPKKFMEGLAPTQVLAALIGALTSFALGSRIGVGGSILAGICALAAGILCSQWYRNRLLASPPNNHTAPVSHGRAAQIRRRSTALALIVALAAVGLSSACVLAATSNQGLGPRFQSWQEVRSVIQQTTQTWGAR